MSCCSLCGAVAGGVSIAENPKTSVWVNHIRALYINGLEYTSPHLSGAGWCFLPTFPIKLPRVADASSDMHNEDSEHIRLFTATPIVFIDGTFHPESNTTGFIIHEDCWKLLQWACYPQPVNLNRFNLFLRSFGVSPASQIVNWGHTYAGLYMSDDSANHHIYFRTDLSLQAGSMHSRHNLGQIPHIEEFLWECKRKCELEKNVGIPHNATRAIGTNATVTTQCQDCFGTLPLELLEVIMKLLPTQDVVNLRVASRVFRTMSLSKSFWYSRFDVGQEYEWVIEPWLYKVGFYQNTKLSDPESVYKVMKSLSKSNVLMNRRRVWELIKPIATALYSFKLHEEAYGKMEPCGKPLASIWQPDLPEEDTLRWDCAHGELLDSEIQPFHFGCRPLYKRFISLTKPIISIGISVLPFHDGVTYITGLRFCFADATEEAIGYILSDCEMSIPTRDFFRGFKVATSERGIHALRVIDESGIEIVTAGNCAGHAISKLGWGHRVTAVKAYFDVSHSSSICSLINTV